MVRKNKSQPARSSTPDKARANQPEGQRPEWSRPVVVARIGPEPTGLSIEANPTECASLAMRYGIPGIKHLAAEAKVVRLPDGVTIRVSGRLNAEVTQLCVLSLEPFDSFVETGFSRDFSERGAREGAEDIDLSHEDPPDPITAGVIDAGEVVAEELALALDPYPRRPEAQLPAGVQPEAAGDGEVAPVKVSPFAALAVLKDGKKGTSSRS